jgi:predicted dehydrogenase
MRSLDSRGPQSSRVRISRRTFLRRIGAVTAAAGFPTIIPARVLGRDAPSNRIAMAGIGLGSQGVANMETFLGHTDVQWLAVCDVDTVHLRRAKRKVDAHHGNQDCAAYRDLRELLVRRDIDAVMIATPDHWHAWAAFNAARAGMDVFGEKPLARELRSGRTVVDAVERYGRVWQTGSWQRSVENFHHACELVRNGRIGKVARVEVGLPSGKPGPVCAPQPVPETLDWDLWLGPAPWRAYCGVSHIDWRWIMEWGGGHLLDWIGHHLDIAHWALDLDHTGPVEIKGTATFPDSGYYDHPLEYRVDCVYAGGLELTIADARQTSMGMGTKWMGEDGRWIHVDRGRQSTHPATLWRDVIGPEEVRLYQSRDHWRNFLDCVKTRRRTITPAETAHRSASVGQLGIIAIQTGRTLRWDPATEAFDSDPGATALLGRAHRQPWGLL